MKGKLEVCNVCGRRHAGSCDLKRLSRMESARRGAETRVERYGTASPKPRNYSDQLADGFAMMEGGDD